MQRYRNVLKASIVHLYQKQETVVRHNVRHCVLRRCPIVFVRRRIGRPTTTHSRVYLDGTMCVYLIDVAIQKHTFQKGPERLNRSDNLRGPNFPYCVATHRSTALYCRIVPYETKQYTRVLYTFPTSHITDNHKNGRRRMPSEQLTLTQMCTFSYQRRAVNANGRFPNQQGNQSRSRPISRNLKPIESLFWPVYTLLCTVYFVRKNNFLTTECTQLNVPNSALNVLNNQYDRLRLDTENYSPSVIFKTYAV